MGYLSFDRTVMVNLEKSLKKEVVHTNRLGACNISSIINCNTRKYHGQLTVPIPELGDENFVLLSSLDETVIQHGAEFKLGSHKYHDTVAPNGHKYCRLFDCDLVSRNVYRVGGVLLQRERLLVRDEMRLLVKYKLIEAVASVKVRFQPFLAFRSVDALCHENNSVNKEFTEVENGIAMSLYPSYPMLNMQFSKKVEYVHCPDWYRGIEYPKEQERGYDYVEDLFVPGYFELSLKPNEEIVFSAGLDEVATRSLKTLWNKEYSERVGLKSMYDCLCHSARQFYKVSGDSHFVLPGFPWLPSCLARTQFLSLPGLTLSIGDVDFFEKVMETSIKEIELFLKKKTIGCIHEMDTPDALLWFVWAVQQYEIFVSAEAATEKYADIVLKIIKYIRSQKHPSLLIHANGLAFVEGRSVASTWMNASEDGRPIVPRTGYVVEINALWYNALKYAAQLATRIGDTHNADLMDFHAEMAKTSFVQVFWNGTYLYDYVFDTYSDKEVRPNMIFAVSLPFSPLERKQQKSILDICTKELLTPRGLRSLSPKSGYYRPMYVGGQLERNRNYHNGPVWPWTIGPYAEAYLKIYAKSGVAFIERMLDGFDGAMRERSIGTVSELNDGNPPFKGHGAVSFAMNIAEILRTLSIIKKYENK